MSAVLIEEWIQVLQTRMPSCLAVCNGCCHSIPNRQRGSCHESQRSVRCCRRSTYCYRHWPSNTARARMRRGVPRTLAFTVTWPWYHHTTFCPSTGAALRHTSYFHATPIIHHVSTHSNAFRTSSSPSARTWTTSRGYMDQAVSTAADGRPRPTESGLRRTTCRR